MSEQDKERQGLEEGSNTNLLRQIRQLSVPVWARVLALLLASITILLAIWLIGSEAYSCTAEVCNGPLIEAGVSILSVGFVPLLVLVYLVFAETGVKALKRKTRELLAATIVDALDTQMPEDTPIFDAEDVLSSKVQILRLAGPTAYYLLHVQCREGRATLRFHLDFNVSKINVVVFLPWDVSENGLEASALLKDKIAGTLEGAVHEGYSIDKNMGSAHIEGRAHALLRARRVLRSDFLWDPASKLYFAQDLRFFLFSLIREMGGLCQEGGA